MPVAGIDPELADLLHGARERAGQWRAEVLFDRPSHGGMLGPDERWAETWEVGPNGETRFYRAGRRHGRVERDQRSGWWQYGSRRSIGRVARVPPDQFDAMVDPSVLLLFDSLSEVDGETVAGRECRRVEVPVGASRWMLLGDPGKDERLVASVDAERGVVLRVATESVSVEAQQVEFLDELPKDSLSVERGRLVALLVEAPRHLTTLEATLHTWLHHRRHWAAIERLFERNEAHGMTVGGSIGRRRDEQPLPPTQEFEERWWVASPDRFRWERRDSLGLRVGDTWWSYDPAQGVLTNEGDEDGSGPVPGVRTLLEPRPLVAQVVFRLPVPGEWGDREVLRAGAVPRTGLQHLRPETSLARGADEHVLLIDAELGIVLREEARLDGEPFRVRELREPRINTAIDPSVFVFEPPPGETVRRDRDRPQPKTVSIQEATQLASFTVASPTWLPRGSVQHISWSEAEDRPPQPEKLLISVQPRTYREGTQAERYHLVIHQQADEPQFGEVAWLAVRHAGRNLQVLERDFHGQRSYIVALTVDRTHVWINSSYPRATTLKVATSLQPVH